MKKTTVNASEMQKFEQFAGDWWDENGKLASLHAINAIRLEYIGKKVNEHFTSINKLEVLDIGCGGGLASEGMAKLGMKVTGIDASEEAIKAATAHAQQSKLHIKYVSGTAEDLEGQKFDVITALEIIEHVDRPALFIEQCSKMLKPNGMIIFSTVNRTNLSYLLAIVAAEYILKWVPYGTHDWNKFVKPSELTRELQKNGLDVNEIIGLKFLPISHEFEIDKEALSVNYMLTACSPS